MLRLMRKQASSWMIKVLLGIIVLVFVFWGMGSMTDKRVMHVATVNGAPVSIDAYRLAYNNLVESMRQRYGGRLDDDILKMLNPERRALDELIQEILLFQEAEKLGIRVSERELIDSIQQTEFFQQDGIFNYERYSQVLNSIRMNQQSYEARHRRELLVDKMTQLVFGQVRVSEAEARDWFNWNQMEMRIDFVSFDPGVHTDVAASEEEIEAFFASNSDRYQTEPTVRARYLAFLPELFKELAIVTRDEIRAHYDANEDAYKTERTVEARHILFQIADDADADTVENKRLEALKIMEQAMAGVDFAELAAAHSDCPSKNNGGALGAFKRDAMVKPFSDKAFSMKPGEISEPVRTRFGWHIINVLEVHEEKTISIEEAAPEIENLLKIQKARLVAWDKAEIVYNSSFEGDDLVNAAKTHGLEVKTTDVFSRRQTPDGVPDAGAFVSEAFNLELMEISDILELEEGLYLLQVIEKTESRIPPIADVREGVEQDVIRQKQDQRAAEEAANLLQAAAGGHLSATASEQGVTVDTTPLFKRNDAIPGIGHAPDVQQALFALSMTNPMPETPIKVGNLYYVIEIREIRMPDDEMFAEDKKAVMKDLREQKQMRMYNAWMAQLRESSDISIEEGFFLN